MERELQSSGVSDIVLDQVKRPALEKKKAEYAQRIDHFQGMVQNNVENLVVHSQNAVDAFGGRQEIPREFLGEHYNAENQKLPTNSVLLERFQRLMEERSAAANAQVDKKFQRDAMYKHLAVTLLLQNGRISYEELIQKLVAEGEEVDEETAANAFLVVRSYNNGDGRLTGGTGLPR